MIKAYIVTEGESDIAIVKRLLPEEAIRDVEFVAGKGSYSAQSLARTLFVTRNRSVALVTDADTTNEEAINEKRELLHQLTRPTSPSVRFEVFFAVPAIEEVFFFDRAVAERVLQRQLSEVDWILAQTHPAESLEAAIGGGKPSVQKALNRLRDGDVKVLQGHQLIRELAAFLLSAAQPATVP